MGVSRAVFTQDHGPLEGQEVSSVAHDLPSEKQNRIAVIGVRRRQWGKYCCGEVCSWVLACVCRMCVLGHNVKCISCCGSWPKELKGRELVPPCLDSGFRPP